MKRKFFTIIFSVLVFTIFSTDYSQIDNLHENLQFDEAMKIANANFDKSNPDPALVWRIAKTYYYLADRQIEDKKSKIAKLDEGINFAMSYMNVESGDKRERASVVHWLAILSSEKANIKGIKASLDSIPGLFEFCEKAISIDSSYGDPYYLRAMINDGLPTLFGGDKYEVSDQIIKAIECDKENIYYLVDGAGALIARNWKADKIAKIASKNGKEVPEMHVGIADREFAKKLLEDAINLYESKNWNSKLKAEKYAEAKIFLEKL